MDSSSEVSDPSDWLQTSLFHLSPVEQALRCQVCKDFFDTPMITSCSHTFCSLCIRRCLTTDGRCPACRTQDQAMKLRANSTVQELVEAFKVARPAVLEFLEKLQALKDGNGKSKKRKMDDIDMEVVGDKDEGLVDRSLQRRNTRSRNRRRPASVGVGSEQFDYNGRNGGSHPEDGLTACPICGARMKEEAVYPHLDVHNDPAPAILPARQSPSRVSVIANTGRPSKAMERLPQLNYSLLKDNALRKKLSELGIPSGGPKDLLIRRHTEWVNLVNANCDSSKPKTKRELIHELESWDKTQGRQILSNCNGTSSASSVMSKNFDGAAWSNNHDHSFKALIAQARRKVDSLVESNSSANDKPKLLLDPSIDDGCLGIRPNRGSEETVLLRNHDRPEEGVDPLDNIQSPGKIADQDVGD